MTVTGYSIIIAIYYPVPLLSTLALSLFFLLFVHDNIQYEIIVLYYDPRLDPYIRHSPVQRFCPSPQTKTAILNCCMHLLK